MRGVDRHLLHLKTPNPRQLHPDKKMSNSKSEKIFYRGDGEEGKLEEQKKVIRNKNV